MITQIKRPCPHPVRIHQPRHDYRENNLISIARYDILHIGETQDKMMVSANLVERIRAITCAKGIIDADTELWGNLGLHGDDAFELLEALHTDCGVDFSDLDFNRFFPNETEGMYYWWGRRIGLWRKRFASLTVGHLDAVIARRRWFDP